MLARLFVVLLLLATPLAAAAPGPSPSDLPVTNRYVYGELDLAQPDLMTLVLAGDIWAYRYDVRGKVYDADDIGQAFLAQNKYAGEPSGNAFVIEVESAVSAALARTLAASFADGTITGITARLDRSTLVSPSGNPYDPPVRVSVTANVARSRESVGLGTLSDAAIEAAFDAGAKIVADFTLTAESGYNTIYTVGAPTGTRWESGSGVSANGASLRIPVDNSAGFGPSTTANGRLYDPTAPIPEAEDIRSSLDVAMGDLIGGAPGIPIAVAVTSQVRALDVERRFPGVLPAKVVLPFVNADGVRALRATGAIDADDIRKADEALLAQVRADVERAFGPGASVKGGLSPATLARAVAGVFSSDPPLHFLADADTTYIVQGADADDIDLALRVGGTANVDLDLFAANGRETEYAIHPPSTGEFTQAEGGTVAVNGLTANFVVPANAQQFAATVHMRGRDVPTYTAEDAEVNVLIDITDIDAGVGKALSGDIGTMLVDVTVTGNLKVIELPEEMKGSLPSKLQLQFISADAMRLLAERGYLSEDNLTKLEEKLAKQVREKLGAALGGEIPVESGLDRETLAPGDSSQASRDKPVVFKAKAHVSKPLGGGPAQTQGAIALYTKELPLTLTSIQGLDTIYTVIAPRGLAITGVSGENVEQSTAPDGRDQFTVTPSGESSQVVVSMAVTPAFVMAKFWPLVLGAFILLVLIIGTPVALVVMKRKKGKNGAAAPKVEKK